jgi:hypothetical protein
MNDNTIINTISKIHFILVSVLSFIFLILLTTFIFLKNGIYIEDISLQNIKVKKLYIKWDEKIILFIKEIGIAEEKNSSRSSEDYEKIIRKVNNNLTYSRWFKEIIIEKISFKSITGAFKYIENEKGFIDIYSPDFILNGSLLSKEGLFHLSIDKFTITNKDTEIDGDIVFSVKDKLELTTALGIQIGSDTKLNLYAHSDKEKLLYTVESNESIKDTRQIVDLFNVDPRVKYWIYDAIDMSSLSLNTLYGWLEYKELDKAYLNLHVKAVANDLTYVYDEKVDSVRTKSTYLEFKDGVLYIKPQDAYSYNFFLDKSWLKIDFSKQEELLTLYLLFQGQANKDLLHLLNRYGIELPFIQTKGSIDANLKLEINLISTDVEAIGDFYAKEAQINYLDLDIEIFDAHIFINNSNVKVENMVAKYRDIAASHVDLDFQAKESSGKLTFRFDNIESKENNLTLVNSKEPLVAAYVISKEQDYLKIDKSTWKYKEQTLVVDATKIPFDIKNLTAKIPPTKVEVPELASTTLSGDIFFKPQKANLNINLLKLDYLGMELFQSTPTLNLAYENDKLAISSKDSIKLTIDDNKLLLKNITVDITPDLIKVTDLAFNFQDIIKSKISSEYNLKNSVGVINLHNTEFTDSSDGELFKNNKNIELLVQNKNNKTSISSKEYDLEYLRSDNEWQFKINSIEKIAKHSKVLSDYNLTNGNFELEKRKDEKNVKFFLNTDYQYKFLVENNKPIENYFINGGVDTKTKDVHFKVNDAVEVEIKDDIKIKANDIGINIDEIANFYSDRNSTDEDKDETNVYIDTKNCYIYLSENRHVISDTINFKYTNEVLSGELAHKSGRAFFNLKDSKFHLYGENFNDEFMEKLFFLSKFKGGSLEFYINGLIKEYDGMVYVKETTILDYKILNNVLAFVNTVPSLVTFSLPGYNKNGIAAKNAYINFKFKDEIYHLSDIYLKSKEIEIVGLGEASIEKNTIDLDLNLKTSLGSSFSKIPLLGHILMGKENVSTTLTVTGALNDPDVNTQIAKDIAVAPFNIIKRTLMYPFELFKSKEDK